MTQESKAESTKFRAWLIKEQAMINVYQLTWYDNEVCSVSNKDFVFYTDDEFKLMRSTGIKGKNNIEIYEGDLVRYIDGIKEVTCPVVWIKDYACFGVEWKNGLLVTFEYLDSTYTELDQLEVVGNIYGSTKIY